MKLMVSLVYGVQIIGAIMGLAVPQLRGVQIIEHFPIFRLSIAKSLQEAHPFTKVLCEDHITLP